MDFYQKRRSDWEEISDAGTRNFNGTKVLTWLQEFFGSKGDEYYLVLAPAFFPGRLRGDDRHPRRTENYLRDSP